jgi:hypothetical protein
MNAAFLRYGEEYQHQLVKKGFDSVSDLLHVSCFVATSSSFATTFLLNTVELEAA